MMYLNATALPISVAIGISLTVTYDVFKYIEVTMLNIIKDSLTVTYDVFKYFNTFSFCFIINRLTVTYDVFK